MDLKQLQESLGWKDDDWQEGGDWGEEDWESWLGLGDDGSYAGIDKEFPERTVHVRKLSYDATEQDLRDLFRPDIYQVEAIQIPMQLGKSKGFAMIRFTQEWMAVQSIMDFNDSEVKGRPVQLLRFSKEERENHSPGKGRVPGGEDDCTVIIKNLPPQVKDHQIRASIPPKFTVKTLLIPMNMHGQGLGHCFCRLVDETQVREMLLELTGGLIAGINVSLGRLYGDRPRARSARRSRSRRRRSRSRRRSGRRSSPVRQRRRSPPRGRSRSGGGKRNRSSLKFDSPPPGFQDGTGPSPGASLGFPAGGIGAGSLPMPAALTASATGITSLSLPPQLTLSAPRRFTEAAVGGLPMPPGV